MVDERKHREQICRIGRRLYEKNFIAADKMAELADIRRKMTNSLR